MTTRERTNIWLTWIAVVGLVASVLAGGLLWLVLTRPIALVTWGGTL